MARRKDLGRRDAITAAEHLKKPYARVLMPEDDGTYRAEILEFPGCLAEGETAAEAFAALEAAAESWVEAAIEMGSSIPDPMEECEFSGKTVLRMPKSLHRKAALAAERDGVSLNQFIVTSLAEQVGGRRKATSASVMIFEASLRTAGSFENQTIKVSNQAQWKPWRSLNSVAPTEEPLYARI